MTKRINYEDDIFSISLLVRSLTDILRLDIDPELFKDRIAGDIAFVDAGINRIYDSLVSGPLFLKRDEHLKGLQRLMRSFTIVLDSIIEKRVPFAEFLVAYQGRHQTMRDAHETHAGEIRSQLSQKISRDEEHIVSEDEFKILLSPPDEGQ
jgi:hypothetical protein